MNIFNKLDQIVDLTDNEKIFVDYIKQHTDDFIRYNASQIAQECYISISTIYRLCHKIDVSGLADLKLQVSASIDNYLKEDDKLDFNYPIKQNENQYQIAHKLQNVYQQTITSTLNLLDLEQLRLSANLLKKAQFIDVYTSAGNIYFAENFKFQMQEIGVYVNVPIEDYQQNLQAVSSDDKHVAIVISFGARGTSAERIVHLLKKNKTPIILITSTLENPLEKFAKYILYMSSHEDHYNKISSFSTRLSLLYLLDCLYTCYFRLDYQKNIEKKLHYYETMTQKIK